MLVCLGVIYVILKEGIKGFFMLKEICFVFGKFFRLNGKVK